MGGGGRVYAEVLSGLVGVLVGTLAMIYIGLFYAGLLEGFSIDQVSEWHHPGLLHSWPLLNNSLLLLHFCGTHSVLARQWVKNLFSSLLSPSVYRHLHFLQSSLSLFLICYAWTPQTTPTLWDIQSPPLRLALYGVCTLGVVMTTIGTFSLPVLDLFGLSEPLAELTGRKREKSELVTTGLYGLVRHPMYTGILISVWCHPSMTLGRLVMAAGITLYLLVAVPLLEEADLVELFGDKYREYKKTTPMLCPFWRPQQGHKDK